MEVEDLLRNQTRYSVKLETQLVQVIDAATDLVNCLQWLLPTGGTAEFLQPGSVKVRTANLAIERFWRVRHQLPFQGRAKDRRTVNDLLKETP